jgi:hypothetical protein
MAWCRFERGDPSAKLFPSISIPRTDSPTSVAQLLGQAMKQLVNLFGRQVKNQATEILRRPARRTLRSETLESRQLLAGDLLVGHNYSLPEDVNGDWKVTPLDAMLVINQIRRSGGGGSLEGLQANELEHFYDVAGNNQVSPLDALLVINKIARGEGSDPLLELQLNPRTSLDQAFTASAFNTATRELTVGVNEVFNLEMTYRDIRTGTRTGLFSAYADILFAPVNAGILEPVLTETQFLKLSNNINSASSGTLAFSFPGQASPVLVDIQDYFDDPVGQIQNAIRSLNYSNAVVTNLTGAGPNEPPEFQIRFNAPNDYSLADLDLPNLIVTPNLSNSSGVVLVTAETSDIKPRNSDGSLNVNAVGFNADFRSRTFGATPSNPSGLEFYGAGGTGVGTFDVNNGFRGVGGVGEFFRSSISPFPFDVFSVPVRMTAPTSSFEIFVAPPSTSGADNIFYGGTEAIPADLIRVNRDLASGGSGVIFVTAIGDPTETSITAGNGTLTATQNGAAVTSNLRSLVTVTPDNTVTPTFVVESQGTRGTASFNGSVVSYTPTSGQVGTDTFTYRASFGGQSAVGTITVTINAAATTVVATNGSLTAVQNGPQVSLNLRPLVTVGPSNTVTPTFTATNGAKGTTTIDGTTVRYTPTAGQVGSDSFTYTATFNGVSSTATVNVTINAAATTVVATNGSLTAVQNGPQVALNLRPLVTVGPDNTVTPTFTATNGAKGTTTIVGTEVRYTPTAGQVGSDSFTYTATFNGVSSTATVNVTINTAATTVVATNGSLTAVQNGPQVTLNLRPLVTVGPNNTVTPTFTATSGAKGTTSISGTSVRYTPTAGQVGSDSFTYTATFNGVSSTATINVTINPAAPSITAGNDSLVAVQNSGAVSKNLRSLVVVGPDNSVTPTFTVQTQGNRGVASFNGSVVSYTPNLNQVGTDTFTYQASFGGVSAVGTISVTINALPVEVTAGDTTLQTEEEAAAKTINLLPLVTVVNSSSTPVFTIQTQPTRGTATISGSQLSYTPRIGQFGSDTIVYRVTVDGVSDTGTIAVTIAPIVADPIARNDSVTAVADVTTTFTSARLTANDSATRPNLSGQPPLVTAASGINGTTLGSVVFNAATNSVSYSPPAGFIGTDSFQYTMTSEGKTATAIVTVTVREYVPSAISGTIFTDLIESISNPVRNGVQDANELSVGGVPVVLTSAAGDNLFGQAINRRVLTNSAGKYQFDDIAPGRYTVTFDMPEDSLIFGSLVNRSGLPATRSGRSFTVDIGTDGGLNFAGLNFTVIGRTGVASATSSLLISQFLRSNPNSPYNINDPAFGSATMVVNPSSGDQRLFELVKGFDGVLFAEIAVGRSSETAIFTVIMADGSVKSAILSKQAGDFVISSSGAVVQILRNLNSMSFFQSSDELLSAEYGSYRDSVDQVLAGGIF